MADAEAADATMADAGKVGEAAGQVELVPTMQAEPGVEAAGQVNPDPVAEVPTEAAAAAAKRARNAAFADWVHSLAPADARKTVLKKADLLATVSTTSQVQQMAAVLVSDAYGGAKSAEMVFRVREAYNQRPGRGLRVFLSLSKNLFLHSRAYLQDIFSAMFLISIHL